MPRPPTFGSIGQVSMLVRDVGRAERFYRDVLGLPHLYTYGSLAFFDCAGTRLLLRAVSDADWRPSSIVYFRADDLETRLETLAGSGAAVTGRPRLIHRHESGVEEWMAFFEDPDGNALALMAARPPAA